jgi:transcriptional regulator with XRE-family HTH domain
MEQKQPEQTPQAAALVERIKALRDKRGWSAERLAQEMRTVGVPWNRGVVTKLETGRRKDVSVTELLALARVFQVFPVHLIVPPDAETYPVTATESVPARDARDWIRGHAILLGDDMRNYLAELPPDEADEVGNIWSTRRTWPARTTKQSKRKDN